MKTIVTVVFIIVIVGIPSLLGNCTTFTSSFDFVGEFHVYGWVPNPQVYGFDYYFSPVVRDASLIGTTVRIASLTVTVQGHSDDSNIGWNLESYVGSSNFGLPTGQFIQTHIDSVSGYPYPRTAPIWWDLVSHKSTFSLQWYPPGDAPDLDLTNGLYAQIFC